MVFFQKKKIIIKQLKQLGLEMKITILLYASDDKLTNMILIRLYNNWTNHNDVIPKI